MREWVVFSNSYIVAAFSEVLFSICAVSKMFCDVNPYYPASHKAQLKHIKIRSVP